MPARLTVLLVSPRLPAGLLSAQGWDAVRSAPVLVVDGSHARALRAGGADVRELAPGDGAGRADEVLQLVRDLGDAVWLTDAEGAGQLERPEVDAAGVSVWVVRGSIDPPGAELLDAVAMMDRLRSPGGCPWDAAQTHESLLPYLLEEAYEAYGAIEDGDTASLADELGDVLLQVLFHARVSQEEPEGFDIDDVARGLVAKMTRRHPHVFGDGAARSPHDVDVAWDAIKATERPAGGSVTDGVPLSQPALSLARKLQSRAAKLGLDDLTAPTGDGDAASIGVELFELVARARAAGVDPEAALRTTARAFRDRLRDAEVGPA